MTASPEPQKGSEWQTKVRRFASPVFVIFGVVGLVGGWAITEPTVEKINMFAGALVFFGLFAVMWVVGLEQRLIGLQTQLDELAPKRGESDVDAEHDA